jgi:predicted GNAT family N-acyltransferase
LLPALALAIVYLIWAPPSADLAAQTFRTDLFEAHGFEVWSNAWYGGLHLPGYSLL